VTISKAVILAGGLGVRLRPLTNILPKPLLPIGEATILEIQLLALKKHGVREVYIASNYMADYLISVVGSGEKYGVKVIVSTEDRPLGTCGPLSLIREHLNEPFFMMNGDILTDLNFSSLADFALNNGAALTVVTKEIEVPFHFGRVIAEGNFIREVEEKPNFTHEILAGIYCLTPEALDLVPDGTYYGVDTLIKDFLAQGKPVAKYLTKDYWIDIGRMQDYETAKRDMSSPSINLLI
jgi:NDP-sugar pyrophosphorylase family protein